MFDIVLVFVYLLLAAQYESLLLPVLLSLPTGVFGAFVSLKLLGLENNIYVQVALVMLIGLLGKNAILVIKFAYASYYRYQQALQAGFREVVMGLQSLENFRAAADLRAQEVAQLRKVVATSNELFVAGYASYLEIITAQRSVIKAELSLADAR